MRINEFRTTLEGVGYVQEFGFRNILVCHELGTKI
jgi:hypothetical protein